MNARKTKAQLIEESGSLRRSVAELEKSTFKRKKAEEQLAQPEKR